MITVTEYKNQNVGVFGLGKAGQAAAASLLAGGAKVWKGDDKEVAGAVSYEEWPWEELKAVVLSPGVPLTHPKPHPAVALARKHGCPVIGEVELLCRACPEATFVGITGTNGKSTTTALLGHILKSCGVRAEIGGNLGVPALALEPLGRGGVYVLEMSSYQLDLMQSARFHVAVLLNIAPDHLDRHGSLEGYVAAKTHIFDRQLPRDAAVIAVDDEYTKTMTKRAAKVIPVSAQRKLENGIYVQDGVLHDGAGCFDLAPVAALTGRHNWQNAAAAYAAARALGLDAEAICEAMKTFAGLKHRLQLVATIGGVRFVNDSKATNADAASNALAPYESIYWIAGGLPKEGGIEALAPYFPKIVHAFLIGEAQDAFAQTLEGKAAYSKCGDLKTAVEKAAALALKERKKEAVVLLSPACASFDQFRNFEERGDVFCNLVETLASQQKKAG